jgi:hypothetical protein
MPSFIENGLLVLEKIFFQYKHMQIEFSLLCPLPTPGDHDVNNFESTLCQKALNINTHKSSSAVGFRSQRNIFIEKGKEIFGIGIL